MKKFILGFLTALLCIIFVAWLEDEPETEEDNDEETVEDPYKHCRSCVWECKDVDEWPCDCCDLIDHPLTLKKAIISDKDIKEIKLGIKEDFL